MNNIGEQILNRITQLRIQKDISEKQMSRDIGKTPSYLSSMTKNKSIPSMLSLITICEYFQISLSEFFDFEDNQYPIVVNEIRNELIQLDEEELGVILQLTRSMNKHKK